MSKKVDFEDLSEKSAERFGTFKSYKLKDKTDSFLETLKQAKNDKTNKSRKSFKIERSPELDMSKKSTKKP